MLWSNQTSPLDRTVASLEWLARQMSRDLESGDEPTRDDYRAAMTGILSVVRDLKPLQDLKVQERRASD